MDWFSGILALLFSLGALGGTTLDVLLRDQLLAQLQHADRLEVRVQSTPNIRLAQGEIDRIQVAGRGLVLRPGVRVALAEVETDPIKLDLSNLGHFNNPLKAAARIQLTEADLNNALNTPEILRSLQGIKAELPSFLGGAGQIETFNISQPQIKLLPDEIEITGLLAIANKTKPGEEVRITVRTGLSMLQGTRLQFQNPRFYLDEAQVPPDLADIFIGSLNEVIDLGSLRKQGITARVLKLTITPQQLELVGFAQFEKLPGS